MSLNSRAATPGKPVKLATVHGRAAERIRDQPPGECLCGPQSNSRIPLSSVVMVILLRVNFLVSEGVRVRFDSDCAVSDRNVGAKSLHEAEQ